VPRWAVTRKLVGVQFVSPSTGWVLGADRILATEDGGRDWSTQYRTTPAAELRGIDFIDATHGWVIGAHTVLATIDGGRHWRRIATLCHGLRSVDFLNSKVGYAVSAGGTDVSGTPFRRGRLLSTRDSGRHWRLAPAPHDVQTVCFASANIGWLGAAGTIYITRDGGRTWTAQLTRGLGLSASGGVAEVQCTPHQQPAWAEVIGGGAMSQQGHIGYHFDGTRWRPIFAEQYFPHPDVKVAAESPGAYAGPFAAINAETAAFIDWCPTCATAVAGHAHTWYVTSAPMLLAERGGSRLARRGAIDGLTAATAADFISTSRGWIVGTLTIDHLVGNHTRDDTVDRIERTSDGGRTWQIQLQFHWTG
jgi:hypothetical protein